MNRSQLGQVPQHSAASTANSTPQMPSGQWAPIPVTRELQEQGFVVQSAKADRLLISIMDTQDVILRSAACTNLTIRHHLMEHGANVALADADELQEKVVRFGDALLLSALSRPSTETIAIARRPEIIQHLEQSLGALPMEQEEDAEVFDSGTSITIPVALGDTASVVVIVDLRWKDRYGPALSMVVCRSTIDVPDHERGRCAWFDGQAARLNSASNRMLFSPYSAPHGSAAS